MEGPQGCRQSPQAEAVLLLMFALLFGMNVCITANPHQPYNLTWQLLDTSTRDILVQISKIAPLNTWYPELGFDLHCLLSGQSHWGLRHAYYYVCPGSRGRDWEKRCGGASDYFCKSWDCVSTGDIYWTAPVKDDLIKVVRNNTPDAIYRGRRVRTCPTKTGCNPVKVVFTDIGKRDTTWEVGKTWGLRTLNLSPGGFFTIILRKETPTSLIPQGVGPHPVLVPLEPNSSPEPPPPRESTTVFGRTAVAAGTPTASPSDHPIWPLVTSTIKMLNASKPNLWSAGSV